VVAEVEVFVLLRHKAKGRHFCSGVSAILLEKAGLMGIKQNWCSEPTLPSAKEGKKAQVSGTEKAQT
jgi:hypothetical protein